MTPPAEFYAIRTAVTKYNQELYEIYHAIRNMDLKTVPVEEITELRKRLTRVELYARAVSDRLREFVGSLEGC